MTLSMQAQDLVLATTNNGKIRELALPLAELGLNLKSLADYPEFPEIIETGETFAQNALLKARTVAEKTGLTSIADDSGLMVDALGGQPGIYSARFGDDWTPLPGESRDERNIRKLFAKMEGVPLEKRSCRFVCCMAIVRSDGREMTIEGHWEGRVLTAPCGENGFGYDPVFFDPEIGQSAASLTLEQKNARSHRGKALRLLLLRLAHFLELAPLPTA